MSELLPIRFRSAPRFSMGSPDVLRRDDGHPFVKVCCIQSVAEAHLAMACGADALGLVSEMPSGPGVIPEDRIADIASAISGRAVSVLLTSRRSARRIAEQVRACPTSAVQLCDRVPPGDIDALSSEFPGRLWIEVVHVRDETSVTEALRTRADALLLDSGRPDARVPALGGTGATHDWSISRRICASARVPVVLAGGLRPDNVAHALRLVEPAGVDVCSGVRTGGRLDPEKLERFLTAAGR